MERSRRRDGVSFRRTLLADLQYMGCVTPDPRWNEHPAKFDAAFRRKVCTFLIDGEPTAVMGIANKYDGESIGMAWSYITRDAFKGSHSYTRCLVDLCKALLEWSHNENGYDRIEVHVNADDELALEFARVLGFSEESSRMVRAGPKGMDLVTMAKLWEAV